MHVLRNFYNQMKSLVSLYLGILSIKNLIVDDDFISSNHPLYGYRYMADKTRLRSQAITEPIARAKTHTPILAGFFSLRENLNYITRKANTIVSHATFTITLGLLMLLHLYQSIYELPQELVTAIITVSLVNYSINAAVSIKLLLTPAKHSWSVVLLRFIVVPEIVMIVKVLRRVLRTMFSTVISFVAGMANFFYPNRVKPTVSEVQTVPRNIWVVIPCYKMPDITVTLVDQIHEFNPDVKVLIVDDSTPQDFRKNIDRVKKMSETKGWLTVIQTPTNLMAAGATNTGLKYLEGLDEVVDVVVCLNDDIVLGRDTISELVKELMSNPLYGAVCSQARASNKNQNLLTRMQGLEYHSFNIGRTMDQGFFKGPLVMHGMLAAYRYDALMAVGGYTERHLIEDYDLTARLKAAGWQVGFADKAEAWTEVPSKFSQLWKQRVRWNYGGLFVLRDNIAHPINIIQDVIGHSTYFITLGLILLSYIFQRNNIVSRDIVDVLVVFALINFTVSSVFNLYILRFFKDGDWVDLMLRFLIIPEFIYVNLLTLVLLGAYAYYLFNQYVKRVLKFVPFHNIISNRVDLFFHSIGYSDTWGTR